MLEYPACVKITQSISNYQYAFAMKISSKQNSLLEHRNAHKGFPDFT